MKPSDKSRSLFSLIPLYPTVCVYWSNYTKQELTATLCHDLHTAQAYTVSTSACTAAKSSYIFHISSFFFCKLHLIVKILKTQWEPIKAWRCLKYSGQERWRTAPGESSLYLTDILLLLQFVILPLLPLQLCSGFALWTSARYFYGEHLLTLHIYIPFLTDFSIFNSAMVDFNNFLSMITKGLKATWQHFTLTWQNQSTKLLYNLLYFCPTANFIKNTISGNIQPFFYNSGISTQLIHSSDFYSLLF